jgi:hypothetical protein
MSEENSPKKPVVSFFVSRRKEKSATGQKGEKNA